jgi:hypothetical protein
MSFTDFGAVAAQQMFLLRAQQAGRSNIDQTCSQGACQQQCKHARRLRQNASVFVRLYW